MGRRVEDSGRSPDSLGGRGDALSFMFSSLHMVDCVSENRTSVPGPLGSGWLGQMDMSQPLPQGSPFKEARSTARSR